MALPKKKAAAKKAAPKKTIGGKTFPDPGGSKF